jgi:hypothetical protein
MPNMRQLSESLDTLYSECALPESTEDRQILAATVIGQALVQIAERLDTLDDRLGTIREEIAASNYRST